MDALVDAADAKDAKCFKCEKQIVNQSQIAKYRGSLWCNGCYATYWAEEELVRELNAHPD